MTPVFIDFETFWSTDHSLTKMNPIAYVMHPDTEIISCAVKVGDYPTDVVFGEENVIKALNKLDWSDKMAIAHNMSGFDAMILAWRCNTHPKAWGCTLAMSKPIHGMSVGGSLKTLVEHYSLGVKDASALINTKGKHLCDFTPDEIEQMRKYNKADTDQCAMLFRLLKPQTSAKEMFHIDNTIRKLVEPEFVVDTDLLTKTREEEKVRKQQVLVDLATLTGAYENGMTDEEAAEAVRKVLGSALQFSKLLRDLGAEVPVKISPTTGKEAPALAKTDEAFVALTKHEDPIIAAAAQARLGVKSTLLETRIEQFLDAAGAAHGRLPVPLVYYGGHTGRWSGWGYNPQNLPRVSGKPSDALRNSIGVPKGYKVVVADLSGIELRVNHFLWKVPSSMALYNADPEKADLYKDFAATLYNVDVANVLKAQRQIGKIAHLGLGFSAGAATFVRIAQTMGGVNMPLDEAKGIVQTWRQAYSEIVQGWRTCQRALEYIVEGDEIEVDPWGLVTTNEYGFLLPSGRMIRYPELRQAVHEGRAVWKYGRGRKEAFLTGGKCDENIVQALARDVIADIEIAAFKKTKRRAKLSVHDELVYVVPEADAEDHLAIVQDLMRTPPTWWPELVTWSEGDIADTYGAAK